MIKHEIICDKCGSVRFYLDHQPKSTDCIIAKGVTHVDGSHPKEGDVIPPCPGCGHRELDISPTCYEAVYEPE